MAGAMKKAAGISTIHLSVLLILHARGKIIGITVMRKVAGSIMNHHHVLLTQNVHGMAVESIVMKKAAGTLTRQHVLLITRNATGRIQVLQDGVMSKDVGIMMIQALAKVMDVLGIMSGITAMKKVVGLILTAIAVT